jgi:hypothetical protein
VLVEGVRLLEAAVEVGLLAARVPHGAQAAFVQVLAGHRHLALNPNSIGTPRL